MGQQLSKEDFDMLKRNTKFDEAEIRERLDDFQEEFGFDSRVRKEQFFKLYQDLFAQQWNKNKPARFADALWRYVFQACDRNSDGAVDFKELLFAIDVTNSGTPKEKLEWAFKLYDISGDGLLSEEEMSKVIMAMHEMSGSTERSPEEIVEKAKEIFEKMDTDDNDKVTIYEFVNCCLGDEEIYSFLINPPD